MTVIAWDGTTLAADRMATMGCVPTLARKIFKVRRHLIALSGNQALGLQRMTWWKDGMDPDRFPETPETGAATMFLVTPRGDCFILWGAPQLVPMRDKFYTAGCGDEMALVALHMGATAEQAVQITCKLNIHCGLGTDTLTLK